MISIQSVLSYGRPSIIWLHLIQIAKWELLLSTCFERQMGSDYSKRLSNCAEDSCRDWNHTRKYPRLASAGWRTPWISASDTERNCCSEVFFYLFSSASPILLNDYDMLWMTGLDSTEKVTVEAREEEENHCQKRVTGLTAFLYLWLCSSWDQ
jgi:hypothetical protein